MIRLIVLLPLCTLLSFCMSVFATPAEDQSFQISNSKIISIDSKILGRRYDLYIKVPHDYFKEQNTSKRYPVLYLNDGPHTFKVAAGITHFAKKDKAIIVGISFAHGENGQFSRVRDLTPETDTSWTQYTTGGASKYLAFIEREVFPFIEKTYRTDTSKRILSGHSLGGSFGAWVLITKPELFYGYILTSPSLWFKDDLIFDLEESYSKNNTTLHAKIFVATGALETPENGMRQNMVDGHKRFIKRLRLRDYGGMYLDDEIVKGTDHYSTFPVGLAKGLNFILRTL